MGKSKGGRSKDFSDEENSRLRGLLRKLVNREGGNLSQAARVLGVSQPAADAWSAATNGFTRVNAQKLCTEMGVTLDSVLAGEPRALPPGPGHVPHLDAPVNPDPALVTVIRYWQHRGRWSRMAMLAAVGRALEGYRGDEAYWEGVIDILHEALSLAPLPQLPAPPDDEGDGFEH